MKEEDLPDNFLAPDKAIQPDSQVYPGKMFTFIRLLERMTDYVCYAGNALTRDIVDRLLLILDYREVGDFPRQLVIPMVLLLNRTLLYHVEILATQMTEFGLEGREGHAEQEFRVSNPVAGWLDANGGPGTVQEEGDVSAELMQQQAEISTFLTRDLEKGVEPKRIKSLAELKHVVKKKAGDLEGIAEENSDEVSAPADPDDFSDAPEPSQEDINLAEIIRSNEFLLAKQVTKFRRVLMSML